MRMDQLTHEGPLRSYLKEVIDRIALGNEIAGIEEENDHAKRCSGSSQEKAPGVQDTTHGGIGKGQEGSSENGDTGDRT